MLGHGRVAVHDDDHAKLEEENQLRYGLPPLFKSIVISVLWLLLANSEKLVQKSICNRGQAKTHQKFAGHEFQPISLSFLEFGDGATFVFLDSLHEVDHRKA